LANFDDTLRALSRGKISLDAVLQNLERVLTRAPEVGPEVLERLESAYSASILTAEQYARIKTQVRDVVAKMSVRSDATVFEAMMETQVSGPQTLTLGPRTDTGIDFDLSGADPSASWPTGGSTPSGSSWGNPGTAPGASTTSVKLGPGAVLKERFVLDDVLGVGGMGTVYRGRDLRKVEVEDKNPYVALKVLNEDFKQHPDSFIALAREASRQQKLAHPNIATVYDFDRAGDTVFMSMELLVGTPLNVFIKETVKARGGLPFSEAFPIISGLGAALTYAHERKIVHSDFKPGNCFLLESGQVKVLDFGIARAVKNPGQGEGDKTLFDPSKLGALTPAYASSEMLDGQDPDTRDDIYALACVAYELFTGRHPFNKTPANRARDSKLVPVPVKGLSRRQNRALARGLAFERVNRSQNVEEFLEQLSGKIHPLRNPWVVGAGVTAIILLIGVSPALDWWHRQRVDAVTVELVSSDPATIDRALTESLPKLGDEDRQRVLEATRESLIAYFEKRIGEKLAVGSGKLDYPGAEALLKQAQSLYPDSASLNRIIDGVADSKNQLINKLTADFNLVLETGALLPMDDVLDLQDVLKELAQVDPQNPLLTDRRMPSAYARAAEAARQAGDLARAGSLIEAGLAGSPDDVALVNLNDRLRGDVEAKALEAEIAELTTRLNPAMEGLTDTTAVMPLATDLLRLATLNPEHPLLLELKTRLEPLVRTEVDGFIANRDWGASETFSNNFRRLLDAIGLGMLDRQLSEARDVYAQQADGLLARLVDALLQGRIGGSGPEDAGTILAELTGLSSSGPRVDAARSAVGSAHLSAARRARLGGDAAGAERELAAAEAMAGGTTLAPRVGRERERLTAAVPPTEAERSAAGAAVDAALAAVTDSSTDVSALVSALDDWEAVAANDPGYAERAGRATARLRDLSAALAGPSRWSDRVAVARTAWMAFPTTSDLATSLTRSIDGERGARAAALAAEVKQSQDELAVLTANPTFDFGWDAAVKEAVDRMAELLPEDHQELALARESTTALYVAKAAEMRAAQRFSEAAGLLDRAARLAATPAVQSERAALAAAEAEFERAAEENARLMSIEAAKQTLLAQARAKDVVAAEKTLASLKEALPPDDAFIRTEAAAALGEAYQRLAMAKAEEADFGAALTLAQKGLELAPDVPELKAAVRDYTAEGTAAQLLKRFGSVKELEIDETRKQLAAVQAGVDPGRFQELETQLIASLEKRLGLLRGTEPDAHNALLEASRQVFGTHPGLAGIENVAIESKYASSIREALDAAKLSLARQGLTDAQTTESRHPEIVELTTRLTTQEKSAAEFYSQYLAAFGRKEYEPAKGFIDEALKLWADNPDYAGARAVVLAKLSPTATTATDAPTGEATTTPPAAGSRAPVASKQPCNAKLAGYGKRKAGTCFDMIDPQARAPLMVVVPAGNGVNEAFAIGKYELPVNDYNNYCLVTKSCQPVDRNKKLPMTGISVAQAEAYAAWLSTTTGHRYRLPTAAEWVQAAGAKGGGGKDYNCRMSQGGQVVKGLAAVEVNSGKPNDFGLYNAIGNVQELVTGSGGLTARGGAFSDSIGKCEVGLEKPASAEGDEATGVRLVRELGQG
jgi:serine/threonine protein kinase